MDKGWIKIRRVSIHTPQLPLPKFQTEGAAGVDLLADIADEVTIQPQKLALIPTGISIELPIGYEAQIRPRSGLAVKHMVTVINSPGTIDSDYRGEIKVALVNLGQEPFTVTRGMRIAQMVVSTYCKYEWLETDGLGDTERGEGGFGSTGITNEPPKKNKSFVVVVDNT